MGLLGFATAQPNLLLEEVDERLITLRLQLRLANTTGLLNEDQFLFALQAADRIGRQLGGWQRSMNMA